MAFSLLNSNIQIASAADASTLNFFWYDDKSTDLNRTFEEEVISQDEPTWWSLEVNTTNKEWNGKVLYLERYLKNQQKQKTKEKVLNLERSFTNKFSYDNTIFYL